MTFMVTFKVDGTPVPKGRARYARRGNYISTYTPEKTRTYETLIKDSAIEAMGASEPLETPVSLYLYIRVPIPASATKKRLQAISDGSEKPTKKPDASNILKSVEDGIKELMGKSTKGIAGGYTISWPTRSYKAQPEKTVPAKEAYTIRQSTLTIKEARQ